MLKTKKTPGDTSWFVKSRFGMFIHWGLYAMAARHEWVKKHEKMTNEQYEKYFKFFDPDLYNPSIWAKIAAEAGMKYFVITTKHHEGFCLWDTKFTDYKATKTRAKRDLLKPMVEAFRKEGLKVGFYHSLLDWHHPDYVIDRCHPMFDSPDRDKLNRGRTQSRYAQYLYNQVKELLTKYKIDILWFDFSFPGENGKGHKDWQSEKIYALVRKLAPKVILNDRLDLPEGWDIKTPEQYQPREWVKVDGTPVVWEACQTFSGSWGYHRDESTWKTVEMLIKMLIDTVSKGGNLLLNVGPTARGEFDYRAIERLKGIGEWMKRHYRSIYGCTQAPAEFKKPEDCRLTYNPDTNRLYIHIFSWPFLPHLHLEGDYLKRVEYAQLLNDGSEILLSEDKANNILTLRLPVLKPNVTVPVIELFLKK